MENIKTPGSSERTVYLLNNATLTMTKKTLLPFGQLTEKASEADILPGLQKSLMSVKKLAIEGYRATQQSSIPGKMESQYTSMEQ